jgi:hypothetical protein
VTEEQYSSLLKQIGHSVELAEKALHTANEALTQSRITVRLLNGNPDEDILGVRPRLRQIEEVRLKEIAEKIDSLTRVWTPQLLTEVIATHKEVQTLTRERDTLKAQVRVLIWGLGAVGIIGGSSFACILKILFGQ